MTDTILKFTSLVPTDPRDQNCVSYRLLSTFTFMTHDLKLNMSQIYYFIFSHSTNIYLYPNICLIPHYLLLFPLRNSTPFIFINITIIHLVAQIKYLGVILKSNFSLIHTQNPLASLVGCIFKTYYECDRFSSFTSAGTKPA